MNPVPYLTVTCKLKDESRYWTTHSIYLEESDTPVSTALLAAVEHRVILVNTVTFKLLG
jgi:hypothetical protein